MFDGRGRTRVSTAAEWRRRGHHRIRGVLVWILVDLDRSLLVGLLAAGVYAITVAVGVLGPWTQEQFLLDGTSLANAYIELQPGIITAISIVVAINQLVLSPAFGPVSHVRDRLGDVLAHRTNVEDVANLTTSPTDPPAFLAELVGAVRDRARGLEASVGDTGDAEVRAAMDDLVRDLVDQADRAEDTLATQPFRSVRMLGAAMHFDAPGLLHRLRAFENDHDRTLSTAHRQAIDELSAALQLATVSREYFRTVYLRLEFVRFSRAMLYLGLPALVTAHYSVGIIGPGVLPGRTLGVRDLLWLEAGLFTITMLPVLVIAAYVARLATLAETSLFLGPFVPGRNGDDAGELERGRVPGGR